MLEGNGRDNETRTRDLWKFWSREWELNPRPADYESRFCSLSDWYFMPAALS